MAKTSRTRNTKELLCSGDEMRSTDFDPVLRTARCAACGVRHHRNPDGSLIRHVAPPPMWNRQHWSLAEGRYVDDLQTRL